MINNADDEENFEGFQSPLTKGKNFKSESFEVLKDNHRVAELKVAFKIFDGDGNKLISQEELGNIMRSLGYELTETEIEDMMYDVIKQSKNRKKVDDCDVIDFKELMVLMNKRDKETDISEEYIEAFRVFDREGNGRVNLIDLKQILMTFGDDIEEEDVDYMLKDADIEEDGTVDYKSFVRLLLSK